MRASNRAKASRSDERALPSSASPSFSSSTSARRSPTRWNTRPSPKAKVTDAEQTRNASPPNASQ